MLIILNTVLKDIERVKLCLHTNIYYFFLQPVKEAIYLSFFFFFWPLI